MADRPRHPDKQIKTAMTTFEFSIIASGIGHVADDFEDRFFKAGCDDATLAFARGVIILEFAREAESLEAAIASAIANVRTAGARVERIEPDSLVSLSEIAHRSGLTRQAISNYAAGKGKRAEGFPPPIARITSESPLWDWPDVARWLSGKGVVSDGQVAEALVIQRANEGLDHQENCSNVKSARKLMHAFDLRRDRERSTRNIGSLELGRELNHQVR